jgi:hypothetical protein
VTEMCIRCGALPATDSGWPHCEDCYQAVCNEVHLGECELREREDAERRRFPDLLLRVVRGRLPSLSQEGDHWRSDCPWCDEDGELFQSLFLYPGANRYHCYACGADGDAIQFLMWDEGVSFIAAVEWLAKERGL